MISYYGKCFTSEYVKTEIPQLCLKIDGKHNLLGKSKCCPLVILFEELFRLSNKIESLQKFKTVKESYLQFLETILNISPENGEVSYNNGFDYFDSLSDRNIYCLEKFFQIKINIYMLHDKIKHKEYISKLKSYQYSNEICELNVPPIPCNRQKCCFFITKYNSGFLKENYPEIRIIVSNLKYGLKETKYSIFKLIKIQKFLDIFEPLNGFVLDRVILRNVTEVNLMELNINNPSKLNLINLDENKNLELDQIIVLISPNYFSNLNKKINKFLKICKVYKLVTILKPKKIDLNTKINVIIVQKLINSFIIKESCIKNINNIFDKIIKQNQNEYKPLPSLKPQFNPITQKNDNSFTKCPCENFQNQNSESENYFDFSACYQTPLIFNKKSLPIHLKLFDLYQDNLKIVLKLTSKISNSFYDIETLTSKLNTMPENTGIYIKQAEYSTLTQGFHKIIMLGYEDLLDENYVNNLLNNKLNINQKFELSSESYKKIFHLETNSNPFVSIEPTFKNQTELIKNFIEFLIDRALLAKKIKQNLLQNFILYIKKINNFEKNYIKESVPEDEQASFKYNIETEINKISYALDLFLKEFIIWGFNSSKYDNLLINKYLKQLISYDKNSIFYFKNIKLFKKGSSITSLSLSCKGIKIIFRDFLNLESTFTSLSNMAKKYDIPYAKAPFPHKISESIHKLKNTKEMPSHTYYWKNLSGETASSEIKNIAKENFKKANVKNMYEYMEYYLILDVLCLKECFYKYQQVLYATEGWDIALNKCYTISTLMYELNYKQEFLNDYKIIPVFEIKNKFVTLVLNLSIIGGITINMLRGSAGKDPLTNIPNKINPHITYKDIKNISNKWKGLYELKIKSEKNNLTDTDRVIKNPYDAKCVFSYDMMSLYASAMLEELPVGPVRFWNCISDNKIICPLLNDITNYTYKRNTVIFDKEEGKFINYYLKYIFNHNEYKIIAIRSSIHIGSQAAFEYRSLPDLFITTRNKLTNVLTYFVIHYDGCYWHGHSQLCPNIDNTNQISIKSQKNFEKHKRREIFYNKLLKIRLNFEPVKVIYQVYPSCTINISDDCNNFIINKKEINKNEMLKNILERKIQGFLVMKKFGIHVVDRNPSFGFCINKTNVKEEWLSPESVELLKQYANSIGTPYEKIVKQITCTKKVLGLHEFVDNIVIHSEYFIFLYKNFLITDNIVFSHVLEFVHKKILRKKVKYYIDERFIYKEKIKKLEEMKEPISKINYLKSISAVLKLFNNSLFGFTLLNSANYCHSKFILSHRLPYVNQTTINKILFIKQISEKTSILQLFKRNIVNSTQAQIGSTIMFVSKVIFLNAIYEILKIADPECLEFCYCDTDSIHFQAKYDNFEENILNNEFIKKKFLSEKKNFFFEEGGEKCGILDLEGVCETIRYLTEKMYQKYDKGIYNTACKGINNYFKEKYLNNLQDNNLLNINQRPSTTQIITNNIVIDNQENLITKQICRTFSVGLVPTKRYFLENGHSKVYNT